MAEYIVRPGQSLPISVRPLQDGQKVPGLSLVITIFDAATGTVLVNAAAMAERSLDYSYLWSGSATAAIFKYTVGDGVTDVENGTIQVQGLAITTLASGGATPYTSVDAMVARIQADIADLDVTNPPDIILLINRALIAVQNKFKVLRDDFVYSIVQNQRSYLINAAAPYPYEWENVFYNTGVNQVEISRTDRSTVEADVVATNTEVYRYCPRNDGANRYLDLNASPSANIASGLRIYGPYHPVTVGSGDGLPFETKWDRLVESLVVEWAVAGYSADQNEKTFESTRVKAAMDDMELQVA